MLREYRKPVRVALLAVSLLTLLGVPARSEWSAGGMARTASADNKYTNTATVKEGPPHSSDANVTVNADFSAGAADASERKLTMKLFGHGAITRRIGDSPSARTESFCSPLAGTLDGSDVQTTCPLVTFPISDDVTLNAQPNAGYIFAGWSGTGVPATCTSAPAPSSCTAPAGSSELDFTARFDTSVLTLHVVGHTAGTAPTIGDPRNSISCAADTCTKPIVPRTTIDLGVIQDAGYQFIGWSGAGCSGKTDCLIRMDSTDEVTATFAAITTATLTYKWNAETTPTRGGFLQTSPTFPRTDPPSNGINCGVIPTDNGGSCSATYPIGTTVTLTAYPVSADTFGGWSDNSCDSQSDKASNPTCTIKMTQNRIFHAWFSDFVTLTVTQPVAGYIVDWGNTPPLIKCGSDTDGSVYTQCSATYAEVNELKLEARATVVNSIDPADWDGDCKGSVAAKTFARDGYPGCILPGGSGAKSLTTGYAWQLPYVTGLRIVDLTGENAQSCGQSTTDLNLGVTVLGVRRLYLCVDTGPLANALTDIQFFSYWTVTHASVDCTKIMAASYAWSYTSVGVDANKGVAPGAVIDLCYSRDTRAGAPITGVYVTHLPGDFKVGSADIRPQICGRLGADWNLIGGFTDDGGDPATLKYPDVPDGDMNRLAGGEYVYICYKR